MAEMLSVLPDITGPLPGRWYHVSILGHADRRLALHFDRNRDRVSSGVAVREAFRLSFRMPAQPEPWF